MFWSQNTGGKGGKEDKSGIRDYGRASIAVVINAFGPTLYWRGALQLGGTQSGGSYAVPPALVLVYLAFLAGVVVFAHHPAIFMGLFLFFLGMALAYSRHIAQCRASLPLEARFCRASCSISLPDSIASTFDTA